MFPVFKFRNEKNRQLVKFIFTSRHNWLRGKELSCCHKLKFSNPILAA